MKDAGTRETGAWNRRECGCGEFGAERSSAAKNRCGGRFEQLYEMVEPLYSEDNGRPSIDPVVLFEMVLIRHLYGLPSLRRIADEVS